MKLTMSCLGQDRFRHYFEDALSARETESMEAHIGACDYCADRLRGSLQSDPMFAAIRRVGCDGSTDASTPVGLRNRLIGLWLEARRTDTVVQVSTPETAVAAVEVLPAELVGLFHPPVRPGDIGRLGEYHILRVLGRGGMGVVCLAEDERLRRRLAIKLIRPSLAIGEGASIRFLREARALAALSNDHIVSIFQVGEDRGIPFLAMEYLEGETLSDWMRANPAPNLGEVLRIVGEAADGLASAHGRGIIHRDLKPANMWLTADRRRVKLLDFGLARERDSATVSRPGELLGTPEYMSPEQARGDAADHRSDLFALGVILYRLCTNRSPFARPEGLISVLAAVTNHEPPALSDLHPWLPTKLVELNRRLLAKKLGDRPMSAADVGTSLREIAAESNRDGLAERAVGSAIAPPAAAPILAPAASRRKPLLRWVLGGLLACVVAAGIVLVVRDKDGKEVAKIDLPEVPKGGKVEFLDRATNRPVVLPIEPPLVPAVDPVPAVAAGKPMSNRALTTNPAIFPGIVSWTLDTRSHRETVYATAHSPDGKLLATGGIESVIRIYDANSLALVKILYGSESIISRLSWSSDGQRLFAGHETTLTIWEYASGIVVKTPNATDVWSIRVSNDGKKIAVSTSKGPKVIILDVATGAKIMEIPSNRQAEPRWSSDDGMLALFGGVEGGTLVELFDLSKKEIVFSERISSPATILAWSSKGHRFAFTNANMSDIVIYQSDTPRLFRIENTNGMNMGLTFSPDDLYLFGRGAGNVWRVDLTKRDSKGSFFKILGENAYSNAGFSVSATSLASVSDTIELFDYDGKPLKSLGILKSLKWLPTGHYRIPEADRDQIVYVVQTPKGQETLTPAEFEKRTGWKNDPSKIFSLGN